MACDAVTRRATTGPCERCGHDRELHIVLHVGEGEQCVKCIPLMGGLHDHAYLGPVLERCGHEEHEHKLHSQGWFCSPCATALSRPGDWHWDEVFHAFEEESE